MAGLIWRKIVLTHEGRLISAQYARDGAYVRVSLPGRAERRTPHRKQSAEPVARQLLLEIVEGQDRYWADRVRELNADGVGHG
jgi:hypothetical protein